MSLAALEYFRQTHQAERADRLVRALLADDALGGRPSLWRLAARLCWPCRRPGAVGAPLGGRA